MKLLSIALILGAAFVDQMFAHSRFYKFTNTGTVGDEYVGIRRNTNYNSPVTDVISNDLRCNIGGLASASTTATTPAVAGSTIGFRSDIPISHPGPFNVYMAKAPGAASAFGGSGTTWFRIWEKGPIITSSAITFDQTSTDFTFTIPKSLPSGDYLVRIEHIALHNASTFGGAQFYISCAQVTVTGGGSGSPGPKVSIPGVYTGNEPSILINIYWPIPTSYTVPGPAIWRG